MTVLAPRKIEAKLEDGSNRIYTLRSLEEKEVPLWSLFCASVFAYKANPPPSSYFERHYFHDPQRQASMIRVATCGGDDDAIVASCRVFRRHVSLGSNGDVQATAVTAAFAGGIGEVCTSDDHRRRGLSKALLSDCFEIMTMAGMDISLLHAAPTFFPVYESVGYVCTTSRWSLVHVQPRSEPIQEGDSSSVVRLAQFPSDTEALMSNHQVYSESRFVGCIIRSKEYWDEYLSKELEGSLLVLVEDDSNLVGSLSIRPRGDRYQLREFCCPESKGKQPVHVVFAKLLVEASKNIADQTFRLHLPTLVLDEIRASCLASSSGENEYIIDWSVPAEEEDDLGWMYKPMGSSQLDMPSLASQRPHLIWPADSF